MGPFRGVDFVIVPARIRLVPEEVDFFVLVQVPQAEGFVPSTWEHIEADLSTDGIRQVVVVELLLEHLHHLGTHVRILVVRFERVSFFLAAVPADGRHVQHPVSKLHERPALGGDVQVGDVVQDEVDQRLKLRFAEVRAQALLVQQLAVLVRHQPVLRKHVVVVLRRTGAQLLGDLRRIRSADDAHVHHLSQLLQERQRTGICHLPRLRERAVHVEQRDLASATCRHRHDASRWKCAHPRRVRGRVWTTDVQICDVKRRAAKRTPRRGNGRILAMEHQRQARDAATRAQTAPLLAVKLVQSQAAGTGRNQIVRGRHLHV
mmetsp:Transcript_2252/g.14943  ORF Transcript_2252/g.14943 Transcript_2252/m.14943 type:complete len:319 (-) Transcript_2252:494-1450(-)